MTFDHTKIKFGDHVQEHVKTAAGHGVTLLVRTFLNGQEVMIGAIHQVDSESRVSTWNIDGTGNRNARHNLVMTGPKRKLTGWLNIHPGGHISGKLYDTKEDAIRHGGPNAVARIYCEIEYEEGEGL